MLGFLAGILALGLIAIGYAIGYGNGKDDGRKVQPEAAQVATQAETAETQATQPTGPGQELFASNCGECHTLAAAGTSGSDAPNLDSLKPDEATVLAAIKEGPAAMPANLVTGAQAQQVAAFVAANAGQ